MNKKHVQQSLTEGSIWRHLCNIAFPAMVGFFFASLYNWVDTFWGGRLSDTALAAMSITFPLFLLSIAAGQCLAVGAMIMVSNSLGAKKDKDAYAYLEQGISASAILGVVTMILFWIFAKPVLVLLGAEGEVLSQGMDYIKFLALGVPFLVVTFTANSGLNSRGNTKFMRNIFILNTAINIWLDPLLMYGFSINNIVIIPTLGVKGLAIATAFVQALGAFLLLLKLKREKYIRVNSWQHYKTHKKMTNELVRYGFPSALQVGLVSVGLAVINFFLYKVGTANTIAGYGIGLRIEQMALIPAFGISIALSALVGQNNGAQQFDRVRETYIKALTMSLFVLIFGMVPLTIFGKYVTLLFTRTPEVVNITATYLRYAVFAFYGYQLMFLSSSTLQGMKFPNVPIYASLVRQLVLPWIFIPLFAYAMNLGYHGVFLNIIFSAWLPSLALSWFVFAKIRKRMKENTMHPPDVVFLIVDIQNDFLPPKGSLMVPMGDTIIEGINNRSSCYQLVVATQDYHPPGHKSFASTHNKSVGSVITLNKNPQILWPDHCVQGTSGVELSDALNKENIHKIITKGSDIEVDSYSAFWDNDKKSETDLHAFLQEKNIKEIHICGLATDYCVKYSVLDALTLGYKVRFIQCLSRAVNLEVDDEKKAIEEMKAAGAHIEV